MVNKSVFKTSRSKVATKKPDAINEAGGLAFSLGSTEEKLARYAVTGTFGNTFYVHAKDQLNEVKSLALKANPVFLAKLAVYARESGKMKDMPAFFLAILASRKENDLVKAIFNKVCTNSKMLLNFVQIIRSGAIGRRSFGTSVKRLIQDWITSRNEKGLFLASVGHANPSIADVIKMTHPRPVHDGQDNMFKYLLDKEYRFDLLPEDVQTFELLKKEETQIVPDVPFRCLTNLKLSVFMWRDIARNMPWNTLRMNLNMLARNGVFNEKKFVDEIADKLKDAELVKKFNVFPYEIMTAILNTEGNMPAKILDALHEALDVALSNVPALNGKTVIAIDTSGSMGSSITGDRAVSSKMRCVDVAALIGSAVYRTSDDVVLLAFDTSVDKINVRRQDSVVTNAQKISSRWGGGTDVSQPFQWCIRNKIYPDNMVLVSDNESWSGCWGRSAGSNKLWADLKSKNKKAKLINIDLTPSMTTQVASAGGEVLNVGGFSDAVFEIMNLFFNEGFDKNFSAIINQVTL